MLHHRIWRVLEGLFTVCMVRKGFARVTERSFMKFPSKSTLLPPNRFCPKFSTVNGFVAYGIQYNPAYFSSFLSTYFIGQFLKHISLMVILHLCS